MDLAALKKLDIKDLLEKVKAGGGTNVFKDKKTLIKFGVMGGAILIFLVIYYAFVSPVISAQKEKINIKPKKINYLNIHFRPKQQQHHPQTISNKQMHQLQPHWSK